MKKKEDNDVIFYAYNLTDVCDYLEKKCNGLRLVSIGGIGGYNNIASIKYEGCSFSVNAGEEIHISIFYDKKDKKKIQKVIDCVKKWKCAVTSGTSFCIEYTQKELIKPEWADKESDTSVILVCSGFYEKEYYINKYGNEPDFKITDL